MKFVLNEYIAIDELRNRIASIDYNAVSYYQSSKVTFCNTPVIPWTDLQGVYTQIARCVFLQEILWFIVRVEKIKNAINHIKMKVNYKKKFH